VINLRYARKFFSYHFFAIFAPACRSHVILAVFSHRDGYASVKFVSFFHAKHANSEGMAMPEKRQERQVYKLRNVTE
jgi:hypothetical protein